MSINCYLRKHYIQILSFRFCHSDSQSILHESSKCVFLMSRVGLKVKLDSCYQTLDLQSTLVCLVSSQKDIQLKCKINFNIKEMNFMKWIEYSWCGSNSLLKRCLDGLHRINEIVCTEETFKMGITDTLCISFFSVFSLAVFSVQEALLPVWQNSTHSSKQFECHFVFVAY